MTGKVGILTPLIKPLKEAALVAELDSHLDQDLETNRKNGSTPKTVKTPTGAFELATPRERSATALLNYNR
ncbi:transposase [Serratia symbiotica]|nr:transposase [Serratia symbiotica]